jgi:hypothetical protein
LESCAIQPMLFFSLVQTYVHVCMSGVGDRARVLTHATETLHHWTAPPPFIHVCHRGVCLCSPTSLIGHSWDNRSWSSFCSSFLVPRDCWTRRKSDSSFRPASVKYFAKWSTLCLFTGKSSWERKRNTDSLYYNLFKFQQT